MPQIELLTVANHAEAVNGLLYISGAGWTDLFRPPQTEGQVSVSHIGIAMAIALTRDETGRRFSVRLHIENPNGDALSRVEGSIEITERQPGAAEGVGLRSVMAINGEVQFPAPGVYHVVARVADQERRVSFRVHDRLGP